MIDDVYLHEDIVYFVNGNLNDWVRETSRYITAQNDLAKEMKRDAPNLDFIEILAAQAIHSYMDQIWYAFENQHKDDPTLQAFLRRAFDPPVESLDLFAEDGD